MCFISGYVNFKTTGRSDVKLGEFFRLCQQRGRDGVGVYKLDFGNDVLGQVYKSFGPDLSKLYLPSASRVMMLNMRAEPTSRSEWLKNAVPDDIQPYVRVNEDNSFQVITHNGTLSNDEEFNKTFNRLLTNNAREIKRIGVDSSIFLNFRSYDLYAALQGQQIVGSYACAMYDSKSTELYLYKNYMPLKVMIDYTNKRVWWASDIGPLNWLVTSGQVKIYNIVDVPAYTFLKINISYKFEQVVKDLLTALREDAGNLYKKGKEKVLVVCSGGLDSTTVATKYVREHGGENVTLLNFHYGCKAEKAETEAIKNIARYLHCKHLFMDISQVFKNFLGSALTDEGSTISEGDKGIEYAVEWVPARNLILMSFAIGLAEKEGYTIVALGANLDEHAAYPDNSLDFLHKLRETAKYSVQNGKVIKIEAPLINLMKHEIVKLALELKAPLHLAVSCYQPHWTGNATRPYHSCGKCGPCNLRQIAFAKNGLIDDLIKYDYVPKDIYEGVDKKASEYYA